MRLSREQLAQRTAKDRFRVKRLARKVAGLYRPEQKALTFIADVQTMRDGLCSQSLESVEEMGYSRKEVQRGLHGRNRGTRQEYPGLLSRGIVYAIGDTKGGRAPGGRGIPTEYAIDEDVLLSYLSDAPPPEKVDPKADPKVDSYLDPKVDPLVDPKGDPYVTHGPTSIRSNVNMLNLEVKRERER